ncbi:hypothetical protein N0V90_007049 [Kalmusia sp. IMI 367209]|nr:hypothetical protein N0V90_007049 [Kalmusia sp. IMI 367209]
METQSFPFLDLPKDIRLMVYERIPIITKAGSIKDLGRKRPRTRAYDKGQLVLLHNNTSTEILRVCRLINSEASAVMQAKLNEIRAQAPRVLLCVAKSDFKRGETADTFAFKQQDYFQGLRDIIILLAHILKRARELSYESSIDERLPAKVESIITSFLWRWDPSRSHFAYETLLPFARKCWQHARYRWTSDHQDTEGLLSIVLEVAIVGDSKDSGRGRIQYAASRRYLEELLRSVETDTADLLAVLRLVRSSYFAISAEESQEIKTELNESGHGSKWSFGDENADGPYRPEVLIGNAMELDEYAEEWCTGSYFREYSGVKATATTQSYIEHSRVYGREAMAINICIKIDLYAAKQFKGHTHLTFNTTESSPMSQKILDVAIIGGGLAGLTAADSLIASGKSVILLEARSEVGGKVQNRTLKNGGITEVGAEFVGPTQDKVLALMKELGLETFPVHDEGKYVLWRHGKRTTYGKKLWLDSLPPVSWLAILQLGIAQFRLDSMAAQINVAAPWDHPKAAQWDAITFEDWVNRWAFLSDAKFMMEIAARSVWGAELREMSLMYVLSYIAGAGNETAKGTFQRLLAVKSGAQEWRAIGGTGLICKGLAARIGSENLKLNSPVRKVTSAESGYNVEWEDGCVMAKSVVIAMPPPLVTKIAFEPALPEERRKLNEGMQMGQMGKAIAVYEKPFWRDDGLSAQAFPDEGIVGLTFDNSPEDGSFGAILGFFQGDEMRKVDKMSVEEIREKVLAELVRYFGPKAADVTDFVIQRWGIEDHLWGGPTAVAPKDVFAKYGAALREPVGGIHFAGTETSDYWPGYMDGAIRSGQRVAQEILKDA